MICECCELRIPNERDPYEYGELLVCEECYELLLNAPVETTEIDMTEIVDVLDEIMNE